MTDYYVRILYVPKLKTVTLLLMPIVLTVQDAPVLDVVLVEQVELSQLVFMKIDEIPELCEAVIDDIVHHISKIKAIYIDTNDLGLVSAKDMRAAYENRCKNKKVIYIETPVYKRLRNPRIPQIVLR